MNRNAQFALAAAMTLSACMETANLNMADFRPAMQWDNRAEGDDWTGRTLMAVAEEDDKLAGLVPADIDTWCPDYRNAGIAERRAFWVGVLSALAKHESTWNPRAVGGGGRWIGLTQIAPSTARQYGCEARTAAALKDGAANLACAVEIMAANVASDGMVAGGGNRGIGRDWAPLRSSRKRADMVAWVSQQEYCRKG